MAYLIVGDSQKLREEKLQELADSFGVSLSTNNPDLFLIDPDNNISIEAIRDIKRFLNKKAWNDQGIKLVIVFSAQAMSIEAQNAFLKTLEEPPANSEIILITNHKASLLPTIVSRSKLINLIPEKQHTDSKKLVAEWQKITKADLSEKLIFAEQKSKEAKVWLTSLVFGLETELLKGVIGDLDHHLRLCQKAHNMINNNIAPARTLDWLMLSI